MAQKEKDKSVHISSERLRDYEPSEEKEYTSFETTNDETLPQYGRRESSSYRKSTFGNNMPEQTPPKQRTSPKKHGKKFEVLHKSSKGLARFGIIVVGILILVFVFGMLTPTGLTEYTKVLLHGFGGGDGFPINISSSSFNSLTMCGSDAVLVTESAVSMYKSNGRTVFSRQHGFKNPAVCASSIRVLSYDRGGKKLRVDNRAEELLKKELDAEIITANICRNGTFAVATNGTDGYLGKVTLFDKNGKEMFVWKTSDRRVSALSLSENGRYLAVGGVKVENGVMNSDVILFDVKSTEPLNTNTFQNSALISLNWKGSGVVAVFDNALSKIERNGTKTDIPIETGQIACYNNDNSNGVAIVVCKYNDSANNELLVFDDNLEQIGQAVIDRECLSICRDSSKVCVLEKERVEVFNQNGEKKDEKKVSSNMKKIVSGGGFTVMMGASTLEIPK